MKLKPILITLFSVIIVLTTMYFASAQVVPGQTWSEDTARTVNLSQYFPAGSSGYAVLYYPSNIVATVNTGTGMSTLTPQPNFNGVGYITYTAQNSSNASQVFTSNNITLTVTAVPDAPIITSGAPTTAEPNKLYQYQVNANDPDNDALTYALVRAPTGMTISSSGLISWNANVTEGTYPVNLTVSDAMFTTSQAYDLRVNVANKLVIDEIKVTVDGKSQSGLDDGDRVSREAEPSSTVKVEVKVQSLFTRTEDIDIEDVEITVTLEGIDDGDDLDDTGDNFDLSADRTKSQTFTFDLPMKIDEGDYDILVEAEGNDENGRDHRATATLTLEVKKNTHDLLITKADLSSTTLTCQRTANLNVEVTNLGSEDEDEVVIEILGSQFGYKQVDSDIEIDSGADDDSAFSKSYTINAASLPEGVYTLDVKAYYDTTKLDDTKSLTFTVGKCTNPTNTGGNTNTGSNTGSTGTTTGTGTDTNGLQVTYISTQPNYQTGQSGTTGVSAQEAGLFSGNTLLVALLVVGIIIVLLLVVYIVKLLIVR